MAFPVYHCCMIRRNSLAAMQTFLRNQQLNPNQHYHHNKPGDKGSGAGITTTFGGVYCLSFQKAAASNGFFITAETGSLKIESSDRRFNLMEQFEHPSTVLESALLIFFSSWKASSARTSIAKNATPTP